MKHLRTFIVGLNWLVFGRSVPLCGDTGISEVISSIEG